MKYTCCSRWGITALLVALLIIACTIFPEYAFARAGGGGGGGGGGSVLLIILTPFFIIYSAIVSIRYRRKSELCRGLLDKLANTDSVWDRRSMKARVEQAFFAVQNAWMERDQDLAKEYMSDRIYTKHKMQTDEMIRRGEKNILQSINLKEALIVEVVDYEDDTKDSFVAIINASMYDFTEDEKTHRIIKGSSTEPESFEELWRFIRVNDTWVLDEISQDADLSALRGLKSFSQSVN